MGSAPAPGQPAIELTPEEVEVFLFQTDATDAIRTILARGVDLATLDAYLANDNRFRETYDRIFKTFEYATLFVNLPLFEYIFATNPDIFNPDIFNKDKASEVLFDLVDMHRNNLTNNRDEYFIRTDADSLTMIKLLINHEANLEVRELHTENTPLISAAERGDYDVVELLLAHGADVNAKNIDGMTAFDLARENRYEKYLGYRGESHRQKRILDYDKTIALLDYKKSRLENSILQRILVRKNIPEDINCLITEYVTGFPSSQETQAKITALNEIKKDLQVGDTESLISFINKYPTMNAQDEAGDSLLLLAIKAQNIQAVRLILEKLTQLDQVEKNINERLGKALEHKNMLDNDAYNVALEVKNPEIIEILKSYYNAPAMAPIDGE